MLQSPLKVAQLTLKSGKKRAAQIFCKFLTQYFLTSEKKNETICKWFCKEINGLREKREIGKSLKFIRGKSYITYS